MKPSSATKDTSSSQTEVGLSHSAIKLVVITRDNVPSFKNSKRSILDSRTGLQRTLTPKKMKQRMDWLEQCIVSALLSSSRMHEGEMGLAWPRRLLTVSLGLYDDTLKVVPEFSFGVRYVERGQEGVEIEIEEIKKVITNES